MSSFWRWPIVSAIRSILAASISLERSIDSASEPNRSSTIWITSAGRLACSSFIERSACFVTSWSATICPASVSLSERTSLASATTVRIRVVASTGFGTCSSKPAARARSRSSSRA